MLAATTIHSYISPLTSLLLGIALIEWPSRLGNRIPETRLDVSFRIQDNDTTTWNDNDMQDVEDIPRLVTLDAHGAKWTKRLQLLVDEGYVDDLLV